MNAETDPTTENTEQAVAFLMEKAEICNGTMGPFAYVPGVSDMGARGPWAKTDEEALAELRKNVSRNIRTLATAWAERFGDVLLHGQLEAVK